MPKIFIPTDRVGLLSFQKSISDTYNTLNKLLSKEISLAWHVNGLRLPSTPLWPEGHYYQCGFSMDNSTEARSILENNGIIYEVLDAIPNTSYTVKSLNIAVYDGRGAGREFSDPLVEVLDMGGFTHSYISDKDIREGKLTNFNILLVPGSPDAGECYYAGLGDRGYDQIRSFVANHGHYLGICGGAYLPLTSYNKKNPYWLNIVDATDNEDLDYWRSGSGFVRCRIDNDQHPIFSSVALGSSSTMNLVYWEGPSITITGNNVKPLAHFESLLASGKDPLKPHWDMLDNTMAAQAVKNWYNSLTPELFDKLMRSKCAFAEGEYHGHKLLLYSPHPEMGNIGYGPRADSLNFLLIYNGLFYLACQ
ncbi:MAG: BPL-N domain-containing protein [Caulobacteraceae bacterium]